MSHTEFDYFFMVLFTSLLYFLKTQLILKILDTC